MVPAQWSGRPVFKYAQMTSMMTQGLDDSRCGLVEAVDKQFQSCVTKGQVYSFS